MLTTCSDIDFIIKDLDNKSRSVVASRKDAMLKKRQTFYLGEDTEKPMLYEGRIVEARVIAVAPKAVRLEVFGVEVSVRARDMAWEWMGDAGEKFQVIWCWSWSIRWKQALLTRSL